MNNKLLLLTFGIMLLGLTSAIYAGESMVVPNPINSTNLVWTIVDNTSVLSVLPLVTIDVSNITIQIPAEMPPQSFLIVFLENYTQTQVTTIRVSSGGGGSHTIIRYVNNTNTTYVPTIQYVPNNTIQYVNNNTIEKGQDITTNKVPLWVWIVLGISVTLIIVLVVVGLTNSNDNIDERGLEK
jgi:hypothetical protein